jgi:hypothetical protein
MLTRAATALLAIAAAAAVPAAAQDPSLTIEKLLEDGWKVAGYTGQGTTFMLLRHDDRNYLIQCSILYDTTRGPRMVERVRTNCYELR